MPPESLTTPATADIASLEAGLDALSANSSSHGSSPLRRLGKSALPPILAVLLLLVVWQAFVWLQLKPTYTVPGPADVWTSLTDAWSAGKVQKALASSLERGIFGFVIAVLIATPLGILVARVGWVRKSFGPLITGLQVLPSVAWVPAAIIWFGLTNATVYFVVLMGAIPSIVNGLVAGVDQIPPIYRRVGRVLGAGRFAMIRHVVLPAALPGYLAGLKQGWAFSWRSLMAAEIIAVGGKIGYGLGSMLQEGRELADMSLVMVTIVLILLVGIAVELLFFAPLERRVLRSRGLALDSA